MGWCVCRADNDCCERVCIGPLGWATIDAPLDFVEIDMQWCWYVSVVYEYRC